MPIALEPGDPIPVILDGDADKPNHPVFTARILTCREWRQVNRLAEQAKVVEKTEDEEHDLLNQAIALILTGWKDLRDREGKEIQYVVADGRLDVLDDALTPGEKWDLLWSALLAVRLDEQKKRRLRSRVASPDSAQTASPIASAASPPAAPMP